MKKFVAALLVFCLSTSMVVPAFAYDWKSIKSENYKKNVSCDFSGYVNESSGIITRITYGSNELIIAE